MKVRMYRQDATKSTIGYLSDESGRARGDSERTDMILDSGPEDQTREDRLAYYARGYSNEGWGTELVDSSN
jgi:hypothetical protein